MKVIVFFRINYHLALKDVQWKAISNMCSWNVVKSLCKSLISLKEVLDLKIFALTANNKMFECVMKDTAIFINKLNRRIERWSPWETLKINLIDVDIKCLYLRNWVRWHRKELNYDNREQTNSIPCSLTKCVLLY